MTRIAYFTFPVNKKITGGIKTIFRHVEALREAGFEAVVFSADTATPTWFETDVPILPAEEVRRDEDILVIPEDANAAFERFEDWRNRKILFCQNPFYVWMGLKGRSLTDYGVDRILGTSRNIETFFQQRFPATPLGTVPYFIDPGLYYPEAPKQLRINYVPRKRQIEAGFIQDLFRARFPEFRRVPWQRIENKPEAVYAASVREAAVSLSLSRYESFSLTIAEALACGCIVAGFTGFGAEEFTTTRNGFWAPDSDCFACVDLLAEAVDLASRGGSAYRDMREEAIATAARYNRDSFKQRLVDFWRSEV